MAEIVNPKRLSALVQDGFNAKQKASSIAGEHGSRVKEAVESGHLNRKLFAVMKSLDRMDEQDREAFIEQFPVYVDMLRDEGRWARNGDLFDNADDKTDDDDPADDAETLAGEENAKKIKRGIAKLEDGHDGAIAAVKATAPGDALNELSEAAAVH